MDAPEARADFEALLEPDDQGFTVLLNAGHSRNRQRFSLAHEVAHTFFYSTETLPPTRLGGSLPDAVEERLCNLAAAELLIPQTALIAATAQDDEPSARLLIGLAADFDVSPQAMARALVERSIWDADVLAIKWDEGRPPRKPAALRSPWSVTRVPYVVPKGSTLYAGEPIERAFAVRSEMQAVAEVKIGRIDAVMSIDCQPFGDGLVCVLRDQLARPNQLVLPRLFD